MQLSIPAICSSSLKEITDENDENSVFSRQKQEIDKIYQKTIKEPFKAKYKPFIKECKETYNKPGSRLKEYGLKEFIFFYKEFYSFYRYRQKHFNFKGKFECLIPFLNNNLYAYKTAFPKAFGTSFLLVPQNVAELNFIKDDGFGKENLIWTDADKNDNMYVNTVNQFNNSVDNRKFVGNKKGSKWLEIRKNTNYKKTSGFNSLIDTSLVIEGYYMLFDNTLDGLKELFDFFLAVEMNLWHMINKK
jgi:hypothetical protein